MIVRREKRESYVLVPEYVLLWMNDKLDSMIHDVKQAQEQMESLTTPNLSKERINT